MPSSATKIRGVYPIVEELLAQPMIGSKPAVTTGQVWVWVWNRDFTGSYQGAQMFLHWILGPPADRRRDRAIAQGQEAVKPDSITTVDLGR